MKQDRKPTKERGLFKRKDSPFWWISYTDENGKVCRISTEQGNKGTAREILEKKRTLVAEGRHLDIKKTPQTPFFDLCTEYWENHGRHMRTKGLRKIKEETQKDGTIKKIQTGMIEIWKKGFGNVSVKEIDQRAVVRFLNQHMQPKTNVDDMPVKKGGASRAASASTRNRHLAMLRAMFNKGIEWGLVGSNPCDGIPKLREAPPRDRFLTPEEVETLLANAPETLKPFLVVALHTGMRHGEILQLSWPDVDFVNRLVKIRESKSGKSRSIPMDQTLFDTLHGLSSRFGKGFVFPNQRTHVNQTFRRLCGKVKLENFRFHDLRHTFASHLVMKGVPIKTVQEYLGHANLTMTMRYSHLAPSHHREAIRILDSAYTPTPAASQPKASSQGSSDHCTPAARSETACL
jgi:integrase